MIDAVLLECNKVYSLVLRSGVFAAFSIERNYPEVVSDAELRILAPGSYAEVRYISCLNSLRRVLDCCYGS